MTGPECHEPERRLPGATGAPVDLGDGLPWLLARPTFRAAPGGLSRPDVDRPLDALFDCAVRGESLEAQDLFAVARQLLLANYRLSDVEVDGLLTVAPGPESRALFDNVLSCLFGAKPGGKSYSDWVRASLLANGLGPTEIPAADLLNVLSVLVATNRTIPLSKFAVVCRELDERSRLETLI